VSVWLFGKYAEGQFKCDSLDTCTVIFFGESEEVLSF